MMMLYKYALCMFFYLFFAFLPFEHLLPPSVIFSFFFASLSLTRLRKTGVIAPETRLRRLPGSVGVCLFWCALCVCVCRRVDVCRLFIEMKRKPRFVFFAVVQDIYGFVDKASS
ncbi:transmembrane protein, putative [Bodo saltans]|uniref:Transmembrane protein, putative n=1 Tax=Bodo saltans TaxID=75058 RepID=A0A0S4JTH3_BODSA|nr:transmembrane protein, putative [Bodo saltans]|eukprot:CUG93305.1 transmembrane protein, putative [Bodo saltans]